MENFSDSLSSFIKENEKQDNSFSNNLESFISEQKPQQTMMDKTIQSMQETVPIAPSLGETVGVVGSNIIAPIAGGLAGLAGGEQDVFNPNVRGAGGKAEQYQQAVERELTPTVKPKSAIAQMVMSILNKSGELAVKGAREIAATPADILGANNIGRGNWYGDESLALTGEQQKQIADKIREEGIAKTVLEPFMNTAEESGSDLGAAAAATAEGLFTAVPMTVGAKAKGNVLPSTASAAKSELIKAWGISEAEIPAVTKALEQYSASTKGYQGMTPEALAQKALSEGKDSQLAKSLQSYIKEKVSAEPDFARQVAETESVNRDVLGKSLTAESKPLSRIQLMELEAKAIQNKMYDIPEGLPRVDISAEASSLNKLANDISLSEPEQALVQKAVSELYDKKGNLKTDPRAVKTVITTISKHVLDNKEYGPGLSKTGIKDIRTALEDKIGQVYQPFADARTINYQLESAITREKAVNEIIDKSFPKYAKTGESILTSEFKPDKVFDIVNSKVPDSQKLKKLLGDNAKYFDSLYGGNRPLFTKSEYDAFVNAAKDSAIKKATESKIKTSNMGATVTPDSIGSRAVGTAAASVPGAGLGDVYRARIAFDLIKPALKKIPGYGKRLSEIDKLINDALITPEQAIQLLNAPNRGYIEAINQIMSKPAKAGALGLPSQVNQEEEK